MFIVKRLLSVPPKEYYRSHPPVDFSKANAVKTDIIYKLFRNASDTEGKYLTKDNLQPDNLNKTIPTVLLIHGYGASDSPSWFSLFGQEYFQKGDHNILHIYWQKAGNLSYDVSAANIKPVGKFIAEFLLKSQVPPENIQLIGHSLGSHLTGFIGKYMLLLSGKKIGRITALDPAGPKFEHPLMTKELRLCEDDAKFVDVVHTDVQWFGYTMPMGHVDFYPNNGTHQPGCPSREDNENCSHGRSKEYFYESFKTTVKASECSISEENNDVVVRKITGGTKVIFGQNVDETARGSFWLETNSKAPFLKKE